MLQGKEPIWWQLLKIATRMDEENTILRIMRVKQIENKHMTTEEIEVAVNSEYVNNWLVHGYIEVAKKGYKLTNKGSNRILSFIIDCEEVVKFIKTLKEKEAVT